MPESSIHSLAENVSIASATNPSYQALRAASSCASRSAPAASASASSRRYVSASAGWRSRSPGAGAGSQRSAEVGQWSRNSGSQYAIVPATRGCTGCPSAA